ncbi:MAG: chlorohydrolase [Spirochaeta sp. LUC14_002_19_P3]|nr:MAG: chlorohydrolase [Spirochaeta sp. LUC14_002_19_P3]
MTLFKNATLLEIDPPAIRESMELLVEDDQISKIAPKIDAPNAEMVDLKGKILMPGMVCSHHHYYSGLARGILAEIGPTPDFASILKNLWWRLDRALDAESLKSSALICSLDAIRAGTTAVIDHHASPNFIEGSLKVLKDAFEHCGLRGMSCYEVTDRNGREGMLAGVEENRAFAGLLDEEKKTGKWRGLFESHIGGHAPFTLSDESLKLLADTVEKSRRGLHIHVAEDSYDSSHSHAEHGKDLLVRLDSFGLLGPKSIMVHGVYLSSSEIDLLNQRDGFLVHNNRSNMNNSVGYNTRLPELKNLALGTDGIGGDMFEEVKFAYFNHKNNSGPWWPPNYAKALAAGNRLLERNFAASFGRLLPGYKADLVVADYPSPTPLVPENIAGHLVFGMTSSIVESVMINGQFVYRNRQFPFDIGPIYSEAAVQSRKLWERMDNILP